MTRQTNKEKLFSLLDKCLENESVKRVGVEATKVPAMQKHISEWKRLTAGGQRDVALADLLAENILTFLTVMSAVLPNSRPLLDNFVEAMASQFYAFGIIGNGKREVTLDYLLEGEK